VSEVLRSRSWSVQIDRSIVISGDTKRSDALMRLVQEADVLVHEVMWPAAIDRLVAGAYNVSALKEVHPQPPYRGRGRGARGGAGGSENSGSFTFCARRGP
jgi:hypothetical protein